MRQDSKGIKAGSSAGTKRSVNVIQCSESGQRIRSGKRKHLGDTMKEIKLKLKYRTPKPLNGHRKGNYGGNSGHSAGKHTAHPAVHAFRREGYKVEQKWNPKP